ncbi:glycosyltransferase [Candidatus Omnitrophota bacterium]
MPLVSIRMSSYNHARFISEAIESVLNQSFKDFELIIIDDASTDNSQQIIMNFAERDKRIEAIFHEENKGIARTWNEGIEKAKGKYIATISSDDVWMEDKLKQQLKILSKNENLIVWSDGEIIDHEGVVSRVNFTQHFGVSTKNEDIFQDLLTGGFIFGSSLIYLRKDSENLSYCEKLKYGNDVLFYAELAKKFKFHFIETPLAQYRIHNNNTNTDKLGYTLDNIRLYKIFIKKFDKNISNNTKSIIYMRLGRLHDKLGQGIKSRLCALKALFYNPSNKDARYCFTPVVKRRFPLFYKIIKIFLSFLNDTLGYIILLKKFIVIQNRSDVLFISHMPYLAGAETCLFPILKDLHEKRYKIIVIIPKPGPLKQKIEELGIACIVYPLKRWIVSSSEFNLKYIINFWFSLPIRIIFLSIFVKRNKIRLIYTNSITCIEGALVAKFCHTLHIWHIHELLNNTFLISLLPKQIVCSIVKKLSKTIIFPSQAAKKQFECKNDFNNYLRIVSNGVDFRKYREKSQDSYKKKLHDKLGQSNKFKIALVGALHESKGYFDLIEAAKIVETNGKDIIYFVAGQGSKQFMRTLKIKINEKKIKSEFIFLGFIEEVKVFLEKVDLFICPSLFESFSLTTIEAMAVGRPVIATKCGGPEEIVDDGSTGILVPIKSPKALADAIVKISSNPKLAKKMGSLGRKRAKRLYNIELFLSNIENVICGDLLKNE